MSHLEGTLHPLTGQCGVINTCPLASVKTVLKGHASCRIPWDLFCNCIHWTVQLLSLPSPAFFTRQRRSSQKYSPSTSCSQISESLSVASGSWPMTKPFFWIFQFLSFLFFRYWISWIGFLWLSHLFSHSQFVVLFLFLGDFLSFGFLVLLLIFAIFIYFQELLFALSFSFF